MSDYCYFCKSYDCYCENWEDYADNEETGKTIIGLKHDVERLKEQIEKMKNCWNCKLLKPTTYSDVELVCSSKSPCVIGFKNNADAKDMWELKDE